MAALESLTTTDEELAEMEQDLADAIHGREWLTLGNLRTMNPSKYAWQLEAYDRHIARIRRNIETAKAGRCS